MSHLSPAELVIKIFGGVRATARAINRSPASISKWRKPKEDRGGGGEVPGSCRKAILEYAKKHGLKISSADLDYGRKVKRK